MPFSSTKMRILGIFSFLILFFSACETTNAQEAESKVTRHPMEVRALVDPEGVLKALPALINKAKKSNDQKELALLFLAQSNACRVIADWKCQASAAANAHAAADKANLPELQIRGLISQSRGDIALQEFTSGEEELGDAERLLAIHKNPELSADVSLAYSSLSYSLGKNVLAAEFSRKGLETLGGIPSLPIRLRLMRNQARALSQLNENSKAEKILQQAVTLAKQIEDPKLSAELYVEIARIARTKNDIPTQQESGRKILELATQLSNSQVTGLGHEVLGLAALNNNDSAAAESELRMAQESFKKLKLSRDERRVLRALIRSMLGRNRPREEFEKNTARLVELGIQLESDDRRLAADDFDARLQYAQQKFDVQKLQATAALNTERETAAAARQRLTTIMAALSILLLVALGFFSLSQRRFNTRLQEAFTKSREAERALFLSESRMRSITDNIPALISHIDKDERYLFASAYFGKLFRTDTKNFLGRTLHEIHGDEFYADIKPRVEKVMRGQAESFESTATIGGKQYHYQSNYVPDGENHGFFALTFDITELKTAEAELEKLARIDSLTGAANRRHFEERLDAALARSRRQQSAIALLYLDIDHFKLINDTYGHTIGDIVIQTFASRLSSCVREADLVARMGGDEFVVLIENPREDSGEIVAKKLLEVMKQPIIHAGHTLQVTTSIGVAYCTGASTAEALLNVADQALYAAKAAGRNTYQIKHDAQA